MNKDKKAKRKLWTFVRLGNEARPVSSKDIKKVTKQLQKAGLTNVIVTPHDFDVAQFKI